jgi:hypothetical protein
MVGKSPLYHKINLPIMGKWLLIWSLLGSWFASSWQTVSSLAVF